MSKGGYLKNDEDIKIHQSMYMNSTMDRVIFMIGVNKFKGIKLETLYYIIAFICC